MTSKKPWFRRPLVWLTLALALVLGNHALGLAQTWWAAKRHLEEHYPEMGFVVDDVNFTILNGYGARAALPGSRDTHFTLYVKDETKEVVGDGYESSVLSGFNTEQRLSRQYRGVEEVPLAQASFPHDTLHIWSHWSFVYQDSGEFCRGDCAANGCGLALGELVVDREYRFEELADWVKLVVCVTLPAERCTPETAEEILSEIRAALDKGGLSFHSVNLILKMDQSGGSTLYVRHFPWKEIEGEGLSDRLAVHLREQAVFYGEPAPNR
ncbi:MAG: hypothetical protein IJF59_03590 [Clostridia bacterium]|nr:hypothetical protein [Clostridia bacterium]